MVETNWHFELRFTGDKLSHPDGPYTIYRSDVMIGNGGRIWVSNFLTDATVEVSYSDMSLFRLRDVLVEGIPVVRVRRALNGNIVGEWVHPAADRAANSPPGAAPPQDAGGETGTAQSGSGNVVAGALQLAGALLSRSSGAAISPPGTAPPQATGVGAGIAQALSGDTMASALQLAGTLLSKSSGKGLQTLGSLLSSVSQGIGQSPGPERLAGDAAPKRLTGGEPGLSEHSAQGTSQGDSGPGQDAAPGATAEVMRAVAGHAEPGAIPAIRGCDGCAHFRPYVRISERLTEELGQSLSEEAVARALNELVSQEEKGKGEEARRLADLYRRGRDRWGNRPPSFFSYCAAHERDQREPTVFIAQIRNPDQSCRPVKRADGQRWNDAQTDFTPKTPIPHSCSTCRHRVRAAGPGEDAREVQKIVSGAISASNLAAGVGHKGTDFGASLLSSYPDAKRRNAATARAREIAEVFARRGSESHASIEPRYLDRCGLKSDPRLNRYRVCAIENPHDRCPDWTSV